MPAAKEIICPFTILIDSAESQPFTFAGLLADSEHGGGPLLVGSRWACLGRHPDSTGDYSIDGYAGRVGIERKSMEDCQSTVLGWGGRRERFEQELSNLSRIESALVVVEASLETCIKEMPSWGTKTVEQNRKSFIRSIIALQQDYRVPWMFCDGRRLAEVFAFRFLERWWKKEQRRVKAAAKIVA